MLTKIEHRTRDSVGISGRSNTLMDPCRSNMGSGPLRGVATGGYRDISPQKSAQVNFFYGIKMTSERLFNSFIPLPLGPLLPLRR